MNHSLSIASLVVALGPFGSAHGDDLFVGSYESETRENFGRDTYGEYKIEIASLGQGKYLATVFQGTRSLGQAKLFPCAESDEPYLRSRPKGRAAVLCSNPGAAFISFAENGIIVPVAEMFAKDEAASSSAPTFSLVHRRAKYYARVGWGIYGFRKVK